MLDWFPWILFSGTEGMNTVFRCGNEMQKKLRTEPLGAENASFTNLAREREAVVGSTECVQLSPSVQ